MLSILIVNWNTKDLLLKCLASLIAHHSQEEMEVIVVDNASTDGSAGAVEAWIEEVRARGTDGRNEIYLITALTNLGYARGNNIAFEQAKGDWLLTLNPDTEVFEGTLQRAIDTLRRQTDCGALGARQISPDGSTQRSIRGFPSLLGILGTMLGIRWGPFGSYELTQFDYDTEQLCPQPMGTFLLFRRAALESVWHPAGVRDYRGRVPRVEPEFDQGQRSANPSESVRPFDEAFPIFFNEVDLLYRLRRAGWQCVYDPDVRVLHYGGESTRQVRPKMIWESHRSLIRYLKKHALRWWNAPVYGIVFAVIWLGALARTRTIDVGFRP